jgi:hypothetical protein
MAVPFPPFANTFFTACLEIANIDMLDGESVYEKLFTFKETTPISVHFKNADISNKNFFLNSGSFLIMLLIILAYTLAKKLLNKMCLKLIYVFPDTECIFDLGLWSY